MLQRSHGTHYCNGRDDSKNTRIWGLYRSSMMVERTHIGNRHFVFEPRHCHLLAMTKRVHLFTTLSWSYKGLIISSLLDNWDSDMKHQIKCQECKRLHTKQRYQDSGEGGSNGGDSPDGGD